VISPAAWAEEWSTQPWADASAEYSDNLQLIPGHSQGIVGGVMNAGMRLKRADERGSLTVAPSLRATRYDSTEPLDSNDQDITGAWSRRGELGEWRMDAEWTRDTTLTSELEVSGLVQTRKRRLQRYLAPSFSYAVSPRSTLTVDAAYTAVAYGDAQFTGLVNYKYASTDLNWAYQWSEKTTVTGTIYGTRLKVAQLDSRTDTTGVQARLDSALSERWDGELSAGVRRSDGSGLAATVGKGWLMDISATRKDEVGQWRLGVSRTVDPSGIGVLVQRDQWQVTREQQLNDWWRGSAGVYWVINKDLQSVAANQDRHYRYATLRLSRVLTRTWRVDAQYSYAWQRYAGEIDHAERNIFMLGIHYSGEQETE